MHAPVEYRYFTGYSLRSWIVLGCFGLLAALAGLAAMYMETEGHWVTGMTNHVVWGLPHVFAFFFIISASGALNVASIGSVFGKEDYQPLGRLSGVELLRAVVSDALERARQFGLHQFLAGLGAAARFESVQPQENAFGIGEPLQQTG